MDTKTPSSSSPSTIHIPSSDVIRLILQFLTDSGLDSIAHQLSLATDIYLPHLNRPDVLYEAICTGNWQSVLQLLAGDSENSLSNGESTLADPVWLIDLYEMIYKELGLKADHSLGKAFLDSPPFVKLKALDQHRYDKILENSSCIRSTEEQRQSVADKLVAHFESFPRERLLVLLGKAAWQEVSETLARQQHENKNAEEVLPAFSRNKVRYDLFKGAIPDIDSSSLVSADSIPNILFSQHSLQDLVETSVECMTFSPDGTKFVLGMADGRLHLWDWAQSIIRVSSISNPSPSMITSMCFSRDNQVIACGNASGDMFLWTSTLANYTAHFKNIFMNPIDGLLFAPESTNALIVYSRTQCKLVGMRTGRILKEYRGHEQKITGLALIKPHQANDEYFATCSEDGTIRVWNLKSAECKAVLGIDDVIGRKHQFIGLDSIGKNTFVVSKNGLVFVLDKDEHDFKLLQMDIKLPHGITVIGLGHSRLGHFLYMFIENGQCLIIDIYHKTLISEFNLLDNERNEAKINVAKSISKIQAHSTVDSVLMQAVCHPQLNVLCVLDDKDILRVWTPNKHDFLDDDDD